MQLEGKVAIVTGAGSGLGRGIAETYAQAGGRVAVLDLNEASANEVAAEIGKNAIAIGCDVTDGRAIAKAVAATQRAFGVIDILVNNAGVAHVNKPVTDIDEASSIAFLLSTSKAFSCSRRR